MEGWAMTDIHKLIDAIAAHGIPAPTASQLENSAGWNENAVFLTINLIHEMPNWCLVIESSKVTQCLELFMLTLVDGEGHRDASSKASDETPHRSPKIPIIVAMGVPQVLQNSLVIFAPEPPAYS